MLLKPLICFFFILAFVAKPYVYQWFNGAEAHVKIGDNEELIAKGKLFSECSFIS